ARIIKRAYGHRISGNSLRILIDRCVTASIQCEYLVFPGPNWIQSGEHGYGIRIVADNNTEYRWRLDNCGSRRRWGRNKMKLSIKANFDLGLLPGVGVFLEYLFGVLICAIVKRFDQRLPSKIGNIVP